MKPKIPGRVPTVIRPVARASVVYAALALWLTGVTWAVLKDQKARAQALEQPRQSFVVGIERQTMWQMGKLTDDFLSISVFAIDTPGACIYVVHKYGYEPKLVKVNRSEIPTGRGCQ